MTKKTPKAKPQEKQIFYDFIALGMVKNSFTL